MSDVDQELAGRSTGLVRDEEAPGGASVARMGEPTARPHRRSGDRGREVFRLAGTPSGDRQLLRAAALGDAAAWEALVETYAPAVWATCLQCGLREDEAVAASALVWMALLDTIPHLDLPLGTWLVAAAAHEGQQARLRAAGAGGRGDRRRQQRSAPGAG